MTGGRLPQRVGLKSATASSLTISPKPHWSQIALKVRRWNIDLIPGDAVRGPGGHALSAAKVVGFAAPYGSRDSIPRPGFLLRRGEK